MKRLTKPQDALVRRLAEGRHLLRAPRTSGGWLILSLSRAVCDVTRDAPGIVRAISFYCKTNSKVADSLLKKHVIIRAAGDRLRPGWDTYVLNVNMYEALDLGVFDGRSR